MRSQDADLSLDDDGDYFTWTRDEAAAVLTSGRDGNCRAVLRHWRIGRHAPQSAKNTLHVNHSLAKWRAAPQSAWKQAQQLQVSAREKLSAARLQRLTPYVDKTVYVNWNAMRISAYLEAGRVLGSNAAKQFALLSLDRTLREAWHADGTLHRVVASADGQPPANAIPGMLDDYAMLGQACLDAWECTARDALLPGGGGYNRSDACAFL